MQTKTHLDHISAAKQTYLIVLNDKMKKYCTNIPTGKMFKFYVVFFIIP